MPELPEVETVRRTLAPALGCRVTGVWTSGKPLRLNQRVEPGKLKQAALNRAIAAVRRRGKYLLLDFRDSPLAIIVHLGMSGRLRLMDPASARPPHTHVGFLLQGADRDEYELRYSDPRRFGQVTWVKRSAEDEHPAFAKLGPDPLLGELTGEHLYQQVHRSQRTLKALILDQTVVAGVGNIYAAEALWQAEIHPAVRGARLSRARAKVLAKAVREVFERALDNGGTSLRDFVHADGRAGDHAHYLWVYDREGEPCLRCGAPIERTVMHGRATYFCRRCQKR